MIKDYICLDLINLWDNGLHVVSRCIYSRSTRLQSNWGDQSGLLVSGTPHCEGYQCYFLTAPDQRAHLARVW